MNALKIIESMGGRAEVMKITGLTKSRISQMVTEDHIPKSWMTAFRAMRPEVFDSEFSDPTPSPQEVEHG